MTPRFAVPILVMLVACSSTQQDYDVAPTAASVASAVPPTTAPVAGSPYEEFLRVVEQMGGLVISRNDAGIRAGLLCSGQADGMMGGVPITEFPTDHALVLTYCPEYLDS